MAPQTPHTPHAYPALSRTFLKESLKGQVAAIHATYETNPQRLVAFKAVLANRDVTFIGFSLAPRAQEDENHS